MLLATASIAALGGCTADKDEPFGVNKTLSKNPVIQGVTEARFDPGNARPRALAPAYR